MQRIQGMWETLRKNPLLASSGLLFISSTFVNAGNYVFNLVLGRWLGPEAFGDLSLIVSADADDDADHRDASAHRR